MKRPANEAKVLERLQAWRQIVPEIAIRSSFVVGFPGETEEDFQYLLDWLDEAQLDRVGAFRFEPVRGAAANALPDPVPEAVKEERYARIMERTAAISAAKLQAKIGRTLDVIVDAVDSGTGGATGRSQADAPEIERRGASARRGTCDGRRYRPRGSRGRRRPRSLRRARMTDFAEMIRADVAAPHACCTSLTPKATSPGARAPRACSRVVDAQRFRAKGYELAILPGAGPDDWSAALGVADVADLSPWCLAKAAEKLPEGEYRVADGRPGPAALGWLLAQHRFTRYRQVEDARGPRVLLTGEPARIDETVRLAGAVALARDLIDTPAADMGTGRDGGRCRDRSEGRRCHRPRHHRRGA